MESNRLWDVFTASGKIDDYLKFKYMEAQEHGRHPHDGTDYQRTEGVGKRSAGNYTD